MQARSSLPRRQTTFKDICCRLRLDQSEISPIPKSKRTWQTCCVCASMNEFGISGIKECPAKVATRTKTSQWNDRYLCEKHLEAVSKALKLNMEAKDLPLRVEPPKMTYPTAVLTVLGKPPRWVNFDELVALVALHRSEVSRNSLRQACCDLRDQGQIEMRKNGKKAEYKISEPQN